MSFDLEALDTKKACDSGATIELRHPETGQGLGAKITLAGVDSVLYVKESNLMAAARQNTALTPANMKRIRQGRTPEVTADDIEIQRRDAVKLLAAVTLGWEGVVIGGQEITCSREAAEDLYNRFPWIKEQVDVFVHERANFLSG